MIQDIGDHVFDNSYHPVPPDDDSFVLYYKDSQALILRDGDEISFPRVRDVADAGQKFSDNYTYLFSIDSERFYLAGSDTFSAPGELVKDPRAEMVNVRTFRRARPRYLAFAGITGHQLALWYESRRYCGKCGAPLVRDTKERMLFCSKCGQQEYPKISPAVIVGVTDGDRLLVTKYSGREYTNYALIAGFCEIGESLEDTVRREVMEEVGLKVTNIRYYKSQPWSFSETLLSGFFCDLAEPGTISLEEDELASAQWFTRENIPVNDPSRASLTQEMLTVFHEGRE